MSKQVFPGKPVLLIILVMATFMLFVSISCQKTTEPVPSKDNAFEVAMLAAGNKTVKVPEEDPGAPLYLRMTMLLNQVFRVDGHVVIPFYRNPSCVRPDFNLLELFDVPAAFGCGLTCTAQYVIESDAPLGTFPIIVQTRSNNMPIWIITETAFDAAAADNMITINELQAANPIKATATHFEEMLKPRFENHHVVIHASGTIDETGDPFSFHVNHLGSTTKSIFLKM